MTGVEWSSDEASVGEIGCGRWAGVRDDLVEMSAGCAPGRVGII